MGYIEDLAKKMRQLNASQLADILYGYVVSDVPLIIKIDTGMELTSDFLEIGRFGKERRVHISGVGDTVITEHLSLGDRVALIRGNGGQRFFVVDRS